MKKLLTISTIGILSILNCAAMHVSIDNPYKDIAIQLKTKHYSKKVVETCKKNNKGKKRCALKSLNAIGAETVYRLSSERKSIDLDEVDALDVAIYLKGNQQILPQQSYDAVTELVPLGSRFEQPFILDGKEGKIIYKTEVKFDSSKKVVKSLKVKVLEATLEGVEFSK